jgi:arginase
MAPTVGLLGVPTSAGSHNPGHDKAPAAWRAAGLIDALRLAGVGVDGHGDLPVTRHRPADPVGGVRDLERVSVARDTATRSQRFARPVSDLWSLAVTAPSPWA